MGGMRVTAQPAAARLWLHDDREEDLVGSDWHQRAIDCLFDALQDLAEEEDLPWHVGNQHTLAAYTPDGRVWRPCPDIMVHARAGRNAREEIVLAVEGPPALVIEVLSPTTWHYDADDVRGKAAGYMAIGVLEYLLFDPIGTYLDAQCKGWRQRDGSVEEWLPETDGRYVAASLGVSFRPEGVYLRTYDRSQVLVPTRDERRQDNARLRSERTRQLHENVRLRSEQAKQAEEIALLRSELERLRRQRGEE